jgi:hypothetical protein
MDNASPFHGVYYGTPLHKGQLFFPFASIGVVFLLTDDTLEDYYNIIRITA